MSIHYQSAYSLHHFQGVPACHRIRVGLEHEPMPPLSLPLKHHWSIAFDPNTAVLDAYGEVQAATLMGFPAWDVTLAPISSEPGKELYGMTLTRAGIGPGGGGVVTWDGAPLRLVAFGQLTLLAHPTSLRLLVLDTEGHITEMVDLTRQP